MKVKKYQKTGVEKQDYSLKEHIKNPMIMLLQGHFCRMQLFKSIRIQR